MSSTSSGASESEEELSLEDTLLLCARRGQADFIRDILQSRKDGKIDIDINCKGTQKANRGWTSLHLASYFGHSNTMKALLKFGASVNEVNNVGDTALHKAAYTNRLDAVTLLLQHGADVSVINAEGHTARSVTRNPEIIRLIEATVEHDATIREEEFMSSVRLGELGKIQDIVSSGKFSEVSCTDSFGNTALHVAAQAGQKEVAVFLLQQGLNTDTKNKQGQLASDVAKTEKMKQLLHVKPKTNVVKCPSRFEGLIIKKKFMGTKPVWAVLEKGVISYFSNRGDASTGSKRRGMKYLDNAKLGVSEANNYEFLINFSDGTFHKLSLDPSAAEVRLGRDPATGEIISRQIWVNSLKEHIAYNTHYMDTGKLPRSNTVQHVPLMSMQDAFNVAKAHHDVLENHVTHLSSYLHNEPQENHDNTNQNNKLGHLELEVEKTVKCAKDMCCSLNHCLTTFQLQEETREKLLHEEREKNRILEESLHALATEHHELERSYSHSVRSRSFSLENDEFFDCDDDDIDIHLPMCLDGRSSVVSEAQSFKSCQFNMDGELGTTDGNEPPHNPYQLALGGR